MCDEGRFGWKFVQDEERIALPRVRRGGGYETPAWDAVPRIVRQRFEQVVGEHGGASVAVQLSPEMSCEEAWLLASFIRQVAPEATLVLGDMHTEGEPQRFPIGCQPGEEKFVIQAEKHPNRRGIEIIIEAMGGNTIDREALITKMDEGEIKGVWIVGGYPTKEWPSKELVTAAAKTDLLVVQDIFESKLNQVAEVVLPFCAWVERDGCFVNHQGKIQPFKRAVAPPEGAMVDGQYLYAIAGHTRMYNAQMVREMMAEEIPAFKELHIPPPKPEHQH
jgi:NADH-quinone oxidoreductase subunit G